MTVDDKRISPVPATVVEALPNTTFRVKFNGDETAIVYLSGKMRMNRIRVLIGDSVLLELDEDGKRGRIVRRI